MTTATITPRPLAPDRSLQQRLEALEQANGVRSYRSQWKRRLKAGLESATAAIERPPVELETMKVFDLLIAIPKVHRVKANKMLSRARCSPSKTLVGLSDRQRTELVAAIRPWAPPRQSGRRAKSPFDHLTER